MAARRLRAGPRLDRRARIELTRVAALPDNHPYRRHVDHRQRVRHGRRLGPRILEPHVRPVFSRRAQRRHRRAPLVDRRYQQGEAAAQLPGALATRGRARRTQIALGISGDAPSPRHLSGHPGPATRSLLPDPRTPWWGPAGAGPRRYAPSPHQPRRRHRSRQPPDRSLQDGSPRPRIRVRTVPQGPV